MRRRARWASSEGGLSGMRDFLVISRANIQIASLPTALVGCALAAGDLSELWSVRVLLFVLLFFVVLTFACNLNCLADADVDALFKKRMSEAVRSIGPGRIKAVLAAEAVVAIGLIAGLAWLERDVVFALGAGALGIAFVYSAPPLRIKKRGWLSPWPVIVGLYAVPPAGGWYLVRGSLGAPILIFAAGYAMLMEGITIVNTCEDHPEDESAGIRTLAHALGIRRTLGLGAWLAGFGGTSALAAMFYLGAERGPQAPLALAAVGLLAAFFAATVVSVVRALRDLARSDDPAAECKARAKLMPVWFLKTRYPLLFIALLV